MNTDSYQCEHDTASTSLMFYAIHHKTTQGGPNHISVLR